jgi:NAD(P)-dependent dehydrogenase (short-subunit alcohol dehydrogenase family)
MTRLGGEIIHVMDRLDGKHILITGASRGLGRQLALDFARAGAAALALVARDAAALERVRGEVAAVAPQTRVLAVVADLSRPGEVARVAAVTLADFGGRLDVLVNNASTMGRTPLTQLLDFPVEDFRATLELNLTTPFLLIKELLPAMMESGGSIVNVTSDAGVTGYPGWGAYGISKFGLEGLSQTWAAELAESGVRVNWVDPGEMNTAMHRAAEPDADSEGWADPAEVTGVFVYLASDASRGVHGQRFEAQEEGWGRAPAEDAEAAESA